ncbi:uncharacterized protein [Rutidosis leptorrhynchoides]|uniref:uncharacterized protein n=1 Tax=Rutidosis leptorrhynchoides TaxID=125765 RepID=UPI003A98CF33
MKALKNPEDAMPWVGLYIAIASLVCILAMAGDALRGFWRWKYWFPNKYFTLNAVTLTLIAITMKLPVDLNSSDSDSVSPAKIVSTMFLFIMLANFLPSLGLMNDNELQVNMLALGIMMITIHVNLWIQIVTLVVNLSPILLLTLIFPPIWVLSVALTVSASRRILEHKYKELHGSASNSQHINFSFKELEHIVKKYWTMAETGNPQFALASSEVASAFGVASSIIALLSVVVLIDMVVDTDLYISWHDVADYKWSLKLIMIVQLVGVVVGCIAPIFRCFTSIGYFHISMKWSKKHINVFKVEKHWIQTLKYWKRSHVSSNIPGRYTKIIARFLRNITLNICIALQVMIVIMCKIICLVPRCLLILVSICWYILKLLWKSISFELTDYEINMRAEMEEFKGYVLQIEDDAKLTTRVVRNVLNSITRLLQESEKKSPRNLMKLLEDSKGFLGVVEFDDERVLPLIPGEFQNSWSLVVVTLTAIAIALPSISNDRVNDLLFSVSEGIYFVIHVEENLNPCEDLVKSRKASRRVGAEIDVYRTWLQIDLQKKARKGKRSKEILQWLGDEAAKNKDSKNASLNHSFHKFIAAICMYRISQTLLLHYNAQPSWPTDMDVFERVRSLIADIFLACFTNLPRVIKMKCHHEAIEKRQDSIRTAAQILGKSKAILNLLQARQLPDIDMDSMAYIDKWRALSKNEILSEIDIERDGNRVDRITNPVIPHF